MLHPLTTYLLQYRTVAIPNIGTLQLVQHPPVLSVADKLLQPQGFSVEIIKEEVVSEHQLQYLDRSLKAGREAVLYELQSFGKALQSRIDEGGFEWQGLGTFTATTRSLPVTIKAFGAIPAEKIIRQQATHPVLIGDQEMTSAQLTEQKANPHIRVKRKTFLLLAWVLLLLSVLVIAFFLYTGKFKVNAAGSRQSPLSNVHLTQLLIS